MSCQEMEEKISLWRVFATAVNIIKLHWIVPSPWCRCWAERNVFLTAVMQRFLK